MSFYKSHFKKTQDLKLLHCPQPLALVNQWQNTKSIMGFEVRQDLNSATSE